VRCCGAFQSRALHANALFREKEIEKEGTLFLYTNLFHPGLLIFRFSSRLLRLIKLPWGLGVPIDLAAAQSYLYIYHLFSKRNTDARNAQKAWVVFLFASVVIFLLFSSWFLVREPAEALPV